MVHLGLALVAALLPVSFAQKGVVQTKKLRIDESAPTSWADITGNYSIPTLSQEDILPDELAHLATEEHFLNLRKRDLAASTGEGNVSSTHEHEKRACAPMYYGGNYINGPGTLPPITQFVTKASNGRLMLGGFQYKVVGPNLYWLCRDENISGIPSGYYTDKARIREALAIAVAMGANTIRLTSCGVSNGFPYALNPSLNTFDTQPDTPWWHIHDYVIYAAKRYGLRIIMPLTDNYDYYHGGKYVYLRNRGLSATSPGAAFYTNTQVIYDYQVYITTLLNHVNPYTGLAWGREPTILAWETGNEMGGYLGGQGYPPAAWTNSIAQTIKANAPNQFAIDGTDGLYNPNNGQNSPGATLASVDIVSRHTYPRNLNLLNREIQIATSIGKTLLIGEFDWTQSFGGDTLASYLQRLESTPVVGGSMVWSVFGRDAQCCNYVPHNDGYTLNYPFGNDQSLHANILLIVQHWHRMRGLPAPSVLNSVACPQPVF